MKDIKKDEEFDSILPKRLILSQGISFYDNHLLIQRRDNGVVEIFINNNIFEADFMISDIESLKQIASLMYGAAIKAEDEVNKDDRR